jgi:hypothetical protein
MSSAAARFAQRWFQGNIDAWDRFWYAPRLPNTLALIRILTGAMLLYSHLVLASELTSFLGEHAWINNDLARQLHDGTFVQPDAARSYLWLISSPFVLWSHHLVTIAVTAAFMVGFMTRVTAPAAWLLQLMYIHRLTGALFGLDQIVTYTVMYLMIAPCGSCYSVDAWLRRRWSHRLEQSRLWRFLLPDAGPSVTANIATRLLQIHLCVIYLFGGLSKARGVNWWDGTAVWFAVGNYEYQSIDMTWMAGWPRLFSALSHVTLFWEVFYCALVWPRLTRPLVLLMAVAVHGGIGLFLGMKTFGIMMIVANMIFIEPQWLLSLARGRSGQRDEECDSPIDDNALDEVNDEDMAEIEGDDFHVPDEDDLSFEDAPSYETQSDEELEVALPEAAAEVRELIEQREQKIRQAREKIKKREQALSQREQKYRERVERLKARETKIKEVVAKRRSKNEAETTGDA